MSTLALRGIHVVSGPAIAVVAVATSAWFAVTAATRLRAPDEDRPSPAAVAAAPTPPAPPARVVATPRARDASALVARNMFCSSCPPPGDLGPATPPGGAASHALPRLIATHVTAAGTLGWATLEAAGIAGSFAVGDPLPGGGVIEAIEPGVITMRFADQTVVRVTLAAEGVAGGARGGAGTAAAPGAAVAADPWADRVRVVGENRWEVDRALIRELVQAGTGGHAGATGVRMQPVGKDGKLAGVRVLAARSGSLARALGLAPGDVIETVDGRAIDSPTMLMDLYQQLGDTRRVDLGVRRRGGAVTLTYDLP